MPVQFRLDGEGQTYPGSVLRLGGSGAARLFDTMAVAPSAKHLEQFNVTVLVPALRSEPDLRCRIGQTGRVFFARRPLDALRASLL